MNKFAVGDRYPGNYNCQGLVLDYNKGFTLYAFFPDITQKQAEGYQCGNYKFALTEMNGVLWFLSEFEGALEMADAPFHFGLYKDDRVHDLLFAGKGEEGIGLTVIAVDNQSGIIKSAREVELPADFSSKLMEICRRQGLEETEIPSLNQKISEVFSNYRAEDLYRFSKTKCRN